MRLVAMAFDTDDPDRVAAFWAGLLGRDRVPEPAGVLVPGDDTQAGLRFVGAPTVAPGPNRAHLHLTSASLEDQQATVAAALDLGARHLDVGQRPEDGHVVLADPGGNEFCVIEPDDGFLAGCGRLGELTCEGSPLVGRFWHAALGWPLVWDRGEQTAIQSPAGGTKVSWDVRPGPPGYGSRRQRIEVAAAEPDAEVARLVSLGARELDVRDDRLVLTDPDGAEFWFVHAEQARGRAGTR